MLNKLTICKYCGVAFDEEVVRVVQYDFNSRRQQYECPVCKGVLEP